MKSEIILLKGEDRTKDIKSITRNGKKFSVTFMSGKTYSYASNNVKVIKPSSQSERSKSVLNYLTKISNKIGLEVKFADGQRINILAYNYSKISYVEPGGMLDAFLNGKLKESNEEAGKNPVTPIFPFGFNESQKKAVDEAVSNKLSLIEGPPGTGKTQTILNIIANAVINGESIAVVSSNNSATQNVFDKLEQYGVGFIAAYLGNTDNKKEFVGSQKPRPDMQSWKLEGEESEKLLGKLVMMNKDLQEKLKQKIELSNLKHQLSTVETEANHFKKYVTKSETFKLIDEVLNIREAKKALLSWIMCEEFKEMSRFSVIFERVKSIFLGKAGTKIFIHDLIEKYSKEELILQFQSRFYELKLVELREKVSSLENSLSVYDFGRKMNEYSDLSFKLFKSKLADKYHYKKKRIYDLEDIKKGPAEFLNDYPVILSTTYSVRSSLSQNITYDYVIVDESSQVNLCTGGLALSCAHKAVIVGDLKQLPHVVDSKTADITDEIFEEFDIIESYRYKNQSLLSSLIELFPDAPRTLLREHYRCHPKIIEFCNKKFYDGQLVVLSENKSKREPLIVYKTVQGNHARNRMNQRQIDVIKNEIIPAQSLNVDDGSLGIITPYRDQTNALQKAFSDTAVKADTVDKFQGQENDVVILSTVDNEISEFTDNANRLNVAISRAKDQLILVVNDHDSIKDTNIGALVRYIEYNNFAVVKSKVNSVFDYLYDSYKQEREEYLKRTKRVSQYDSENLAYKLISEVIRDLNQQEETSYRCSSHIPVKMIVNDYSSLTEEEVKYAMNSWTHVDFLIYDSFGKMPKLAIEVDGVNYHKEGSRQGERDLLKNSIFEKIGVPLLRFRTDGSGEKEKLIKLMKEI
ncbi:AAA domain-containing protein [Halobacteriovorax sp. ZH5_bin.2]|uniref:AAA domain-containing protein n=1 Tax=Halobacteriovorax sp. ZH5_bin.2 TaxID=3157727 RepID=UPI00371FEAEB